jgi:hypothetical protein
MRLGDKRKEIKKRLEQSSNTPDSVPKKLAGRYEFDPKVIGKGVSSIVLSAVDLVTSRRVAVKKITRFL